MHIWSGHKSLINNWKINNSSCTALYNGPLTSSSNCCLDKGVQLLVTTDGQLQVTWCNTLHLQVFGGIARQLKYLRTKTTVCTQWHKQLHPKVKQCNIAQADFQCKLTNMHKLGNIYFSSEVLKDSSTIHSCCGSYATVAGCASLQVPVDTSHRELTGNR